MEILQALSPNYSTGRKCKSIIAIVDHITAGLMPGTLSWLCNPSAQASSHYLVCKDGQIYQLVEDENTAWHAGIVNDPDWSLYDGTNPNRYTIGIEHECLEGGELTEAQYQSTFWLHKYLIDKWNIPADTDHIIGHYRIDSINRPNDPGPDFPWQRLFTDLKGDSDMPEGAAAATISVNGKDFPAYILNGYTFFRQGVSVRDFMECVNRTLVWDSNNLTLNIK